MWVVAQGLVPELASGALSLMLEMEGEVRPVLLTPEPPFDTSRTHRGCYSVGMLYLGHFGWQAARAMFAGAGGLATLAVLLGSLSGWVVRAAAYALRQYVFDPQLTLLVDLDDAVRSQP
eukprot:1188298-Prorocentrum_minimum.AAC.1